MAKALERSIRSWSNAFGLVPLADEGLADAHQAVRILVFRTFRSSIALTVRLLGDGVHELELVALPAAEGPHRSQRHLEGPDVDAFAALLARLDLAQAVPRESYARDGEVFLFEHWRGAAIGFETDELDPALRAWLQDALDLARHQLADARSQRALAEISADLRRGE